MLFSWGRFGVRLPAGSGSSFNSIDGNKMAGNPAKWIATGACDARQKEAAKFHIQRVAK
jgi:hypothetical protein